MGDIAAATARRILNIALRRSRLFTSLPTPQRTKPFCSLRREIYASQFYANRLPSSGQRIQALGRVALPTKRGWRIRGSDIIAQMDGKSPLRADWGRVVGGQKWGARLEQRFWVAGWLGSRAERDDIVKAYSTTVIGRLRSTGYP
ncbi:uncharacterized protein [Physcomitrium patens]|uniref:Uncharacterized protein n=2 Tax=Physcomitrium patens TaxID=3218 RepID=A9SK90_PHYPA|nr:uncharacterized protein LOC112284553 [Physcomitrium patens]PNR51044.1 hypothetical protein PHYPA_010230 [Physcomitrium patens]|eukprot:XP_024380205.1 uncharacterized protein LOC112284553 [Physcomitrella patens]